MSRYWYLIFVLALILSGCGGQFFAAPHVTETPTSTLTPTPSPTWTPSPTPTQTPTQTPTITPSPTPDWPVQGPEHVVCPILLYHRIDTPPYPSRYYVTPQDFESHMQMLKDWGYTTIPLSLLIEALTKGAPLPPRPLVLTFDDGDISVYTNAWPIMQKFGFIGVVYIVGNRLQADGYMNADQIRELTNAGWEVGSHSMSHADLTKAHSKDQNTLTWETKQSRLDLEAAIGVPVRTFAYPFGLMDDAVGRAVKSAGYEAAVGLGYTADQWNTMLYYLWRREIKGDYTIETFRLVMPWSDLSNTATPVP